MYYVQNQCGILFKLTINTHLRVLRTQCINLKNNVLIHKINKEDKLCKVNFENYAFWQYNSALIFQFLHSCFVMVKEEKTIKHISWGFKCVLNLSKLNESLAVIDHPFIKILPVPWNELLLLVPSGSANYQLGLANIIGGESQAQ